MGGGKRIPILFLHDLRREGGGGYYSNIFFEKKGGDSEGGGIPILFFEGWKSEEGAPILELKGGVGGGREYILQGGGEISV